MFIIFSDCAWQVGNRKSDFTMRSGRSGKCSSETKTSKSYRITKPKTILSMQPKSLKSFTNPRKLISMCFRNLRSCLKATLVAPVTKWWFHRMFLIHCFHVVTTCVEYAFLSMGVLSRSSIVLKSKSVHCVSKISIIMLKT